MRWTIRPPLGSRLLSTGLAKVTFQNAKALSEGVSELRINPGPGYRIYFGWDGRLLVILLGGGTKRRQQSDIQTGAATRRARRLEGQRGTDHAPDEKLSRDGAGAGSTRHQIPPSIARRGDAGAGRW